MKEVGRRWKSLSPEEKQEFENKAKEDKKRFDREMAEFNKEINKVNITLSDNNKKAKFQKKKTKKGTPKNKNKKKRKKNNSEAYTEYYYPGKTYEPQQTEENKPKNDYSLRRRNRRVKKEYLSSDSEEYKEDESDKVSYNKANAAQEVPEQENKPTAMPKKPLSSYIFFSQQVREKIKKDNPKLSVNELMKEISNRWANISDKEKLPYNDMAKNDKYRYENELEEYKNKLKQQQKDDKDQQEVTGQRRSKNEFNMNNMRPQNESAPAMKNTDVRIVPSRGRGSGNKITLSVPQEQNRQQKVGAPANRTKRERRSKKKFDYQVKPPQDNDEFMPQMNNDFMEGRSSFSNNRLLVNDDKFTERSNKDSINFPFVDDEDKD